MLQHRHQQTAPGHWRCPTAKRMLALLAFSLLLFPVSVLLHNVVSALLELEEPLFFLLAVVVARLC